MDDATIKTPAKTEGKRTPALAHDWFPFESLRHQVDRLFDDFNKGFVRSPFAGSIFSAEPFWRHEMTSGAVPAVNIVDTDKAYEITAELPGLDEKDIELKLDDGVLTIKGEKTESKEEKKKDYFVSERRFGSFQRSFRVPEAVDSDKIDAHFAKGVLTVTLPKGVQAVKKERKIPISAT